MESPVTFQVGGEQIVGMLHLPEEVNAPVSSVVMLHGFKGNKQATHRMFVKMARALASAGIASLRIDFRGSGDSEGCFSQMTVAREIEDAETAVAYLRDCKEINADAVGVLGLSLGGLVAAHVLGRDQRLKAGVLWSAVGDSVAAAERKFEPRFESQFAEMGFCDMYGWPVGQKLAQELVTLDPPKALAETHAPILLIHGTEDETVPVEDAYLFGQALVKAGKEYELQTIKGADHTYNSLQWETKVILATLGWFDQKLR